MSRIVMLGRGAAAMGLLMWSAPLAGQRTMELPKRDQAIEPAAEDVFQVGTFDGEDWETFGEIGQVGFDAQGNLYILDRQNTRVVVVDRDGNFVRQFGKAGEGPGELRMAGSMGVLPDGGVVIADGAHRAYMVYDPDGEFSHEVSMGDGMSISLGRLQPDPRGSAVFNGAGAGFSMRMSFGGGAPDAPQGRPIQRVTLGEDGAVSDFYTAWMPPPADDDEGAQVNMGGERVIRMGAGPRIFEPSLYSAVLPDGGLAVVDSSAYAVKLVGPDGHDRGRITRDIAPVQVTKRIEEREKQRQLDDIESGEGPQMRVVVRGSDGSAQSLGQDRIREMQKQQLENRGFYPEIPVVAGLAASPRGTIWLERSTVNPDDDGPIDLFRADGTYLGTIPDDGLRIPQAFGPDGLVAYVERDEMDIPSVHVMRLPAEIR